MKNIEHNVGFVCGKQVTLQNSITITCSDILRQERTLTLNSPTTDDLLNIVQGFYVFISSQSTVGLLGFTCEVPAIKNNLNQFLGIKKKQIEEAL